MFKLLLLFSLLFYIVSSETEYSKDRLPASILFRDLNDIKIENQISIYDEAYINYLPVDVSFRMIENYKITYKGIEVTEDNLVVDYPELNANTSKLLIYCSECDVFQSEKDIKIINFISIIACQYLSDKIIKTFKLMTLVNKSRDLDIIIDYFMVNGKFNILKFYNLYVNNNDIENCHNIKYNFCAYKTNFIKNFFKKDKNMDYSDILSIRSLLIK